MTTAGADAKQSVKKKENENVRNVVKRKAFLKMKFNQGPGHMEQTSC